MNSTRRAFLQSARTIAVAGAAISAQGIAEENDLKHSFIGPCWSPPNDDLTIHVYDQISGAYIGDALVRLVPRFNGTELEKYTGAMTGNAVFSSGQDGRYDVEISHPSYPSGGFLGNKNFTSATLPQTVHCPL
ncbi:MAG: hypothetical protein IT366_14355 [Candidatus Hydrogenedentes bacterium]|nr:hypothetical protein [Candidatus Hydrogenedentota bacterium]